MSRCRPARALFLACFVALGGCGKPADEAPPVATPSITLSHADAAAGGPLEMTYRFTVAPDAPAFAEDYWVFVHFLDTDEELMWTDDHAPSPSTRTWKPGQTIQYTRTMFVPKFPYVGETRIEVGLFSPKTGQRLPLQGEAHGQRAYRAGTFNLRLQSENLFVVFKDGWHATEVADDGAGTEWQWSKKTATLAFRNPKRDATFYFEADQPVAGLPQPQQVRLIVGEHVIDSYQAVNGERQLRKVAIRGDQFGSGETTEITVSVEPTFVPALLPQLKSSDQRELGIRVFRAFVQPR